LSDGVALQARWLAGRVGAVLTRPRATWRVIAEEPASVRELFKGYVAPLAAVPALCGLVGPLVFTFDIAGVRVRPSVVGLTLATALGYAVTLAGVWLLAAWVNLVAPAFGARRDFAQAFKLAAYAGTAAWVAGLFQIYPSAGFSVGLLGGGYSLYILYLGLTEVMGVPEERLLTCFAAVLAGVVALALGGGALTHLAAEAGGPLAVVR